MKNLEINSIPSPFCNCPHDILRLIFEASVTRDAEGFKTARILSHICRYWRAISLSTPSIWRCVSFSARRPLDVTKDFLETVLERVGVCGLLLVIKYIPFKQLQKLQYFDLERITNLESLSLQLTGPLLPTGPSLSKLLNLSGVNLKRLDLILNYNSFSRSDLEFWNLPFLFPNLQHLHIEADLIVSIHFQDTYPTIKDLSLRGLGCNIPNVIKCFPNATALKLDDTEDLRTHDIELEMPHLKSFRFYQSHLGNWLKSLSCPVLEEFWCDAIRKPSDTLKFMERNRSITSLVVNVRNPSKLQGLANVAPQLQHLVVHGPGKEYYFPSLKNQSLFPLLKTLTLCNLGFRSLDEFEALVRARCLPVDHSESELLEGCVPLEVLAVVLVNQERFEDMPLVESEFMKKARVWIEEDETWSWMKRQKVCMSWKRI